MLAANCGSIQGQSREDSTVYSSVGRTVFGHLEYRNHSLTAGACKNQATCRLFSYLSCRNVCLHATSPETAAQRSTARLAVDTLVTASLLLLSRIAAVKVPPSFLIIETLCVRVL